MWFLGHLSFRLFWAWTNSYLESSRILLIDAEKAHFQRNPFGADICSYQFQLHFYYVSFVVVFFELCKSPCEADFCLKQEDYARSNLYEIKKNDPRKWKAFEEVFKNSSIDDFISRFEGEMLIPDAVFGHNSLISKYLREMVEVFDSIECNYYYCDWAGKVPHVLAFKLQFSLC